MNMNITAEEARRFVNILEGEYSNDHLYLLVKINILSCVKDKRYFYYEILFLTQDVIDRLISEGYKVGDLETDCRKISW